MVMYDEEKKKKKRKKRLHWFYTFSSHTQLFFFYSVVAVEIGEKIDIEVFIIQEKQRKKKLESGLFVRMFIANIWKIIHM